MRTADRGRRGFRQAEEANLTLLLQPRHGANRLLDRHVRVDAVLVVEVDDVDAQPPQAGLAGRANIIGIALHCRGTRRSRRARCRTWSPGTPRSGGRGSPCPTSSSFLPTPYMSAVSRKLTPRSSAWWIVAIDSSSLRRPVELAHAHAAEADGRYFGSVAAEPPLADVMHEVFSFLIHRHVRRAFACPVAALHQEQQRKHRERHDHHQLEVVEIGDEQRLPRDFRIDESKRSRSRDRGDRLQDRGIAVGIVCWVMFWARSAWLTCVIRTSCVLTTEMPIDPPILRDRLSSAAAVVRSRGATSRMPGSGAARRSGRDRALARRRS